MLFSKYCVLLCCVSKQPLKLIVCFNYMKVVGTLDLLRSRVLSKVWKCLEEKREKGEKLEGRGDWLYTLEWGDHLYLLKS